MKRTLLDKITKFRKMDFQDLLFTEVFRNEHINISMDVYNVGVKTPYINKKRPNGANKIIIPLTGKLRVVSESGTLVCEPEKEGLSLVIIDSDEKRSFENIGNVPSRVLSFYAPPFQVKELDHLRGQFKNIPKHL